MSGVTFIIGGDPRFAATGGGFRCEGNLSQLRVPMRDLGSNPCAGMDEGTAVASLILILVMLVLSILFMTGVVFLTAVRWSFFNVSEDFNFYGHDFSLPTIDHSRLINNDGGTAEPLIDGSVLCNALCFALHNSAVVL